ncbi:SseB family protein [Streptomyces sp. CAU 1734]|uniref:SseB family protein n=1 Tax=Streptomyces sp. CAU 1734 TaxID=3140360 RepID=UPI003261105C
MTDNGGAIPGQRRSRLADLADMAAAPQAERQDEPAPPPAAAEARRPSPEEELARARRDFAVILGEFRRTAVLVPFDDHDSLWTADQNGIRWICAFSDEQALARFAAARGEAGRQWTYRTVLGARLLDAMIPALGIPAGVALDAGSADGMLFPPVVGIVPDAVALDHEQPAHAGETV